MFIFISAPSRNPLDEDEGVEVFTFDCDLFDLIISLAAAAATKDKDLPKIEEINYYYSSSIIFEWFANEMKTTKCLVVIDFGWSAECIDLPLV